MLRTIFIGCLFVAIGYGGSDTLLLPPDYEKLMEFFDELFNFQSGNKEARVYFEGNLTDVPGGLSGRVKVGFSNGPELLNNVKVSYPDSNTKLCTMELKIPDGISIDSTTNAFNLRLSNCRALLQFSVSNKTGVTIKPETVALYDCTVKLDSGAVSPWGPQVTKGLSNLLKNKAEEYLIHQYNSTDYFSFDYFKLNQPTNDEFEERLYTILISV